MVEPIKEEVPVVFMDNPHAPEVFSTGYTGFWLHNGNVHITFEAARLSHATTPCPINRVVIARLVIPISAAQNLAAGLYDFLQQHGLDPVPKPTDALIQ